MQLLNAALPTSLAFTREHLRAPFTLVLLILIPVFFVFIFASVVGEFAEALGGTLAGQSASAISAGWAAAFLCGTLAFFQVRPGMTIIAAGNNTWLRSEIDPAIFGKADLVVVDDLDNARVEAGELMRAAELGHISWDRVVSLADVLGGGRAGRASEDQLIVCELQGIGIEDVAVAELVARRAREHGVGLELPA